MTKAEALKLFREIDNSPKGDTIWRREAWYNFIDALCKNGDITQLQRDSWSNPFRVGAKSTSNLVR